MSIYPRLITYKTIPKQRSKIGAGVSLRAKFRSAVGNIWLLLGTGLVFLYVGRVSVLSLWAGSFSPLLQWGGQVSLVVVVVLLIAKGGGAYSAPGLVFIALTLPGVLLGENFSQSVVKWAAWAVLFFVVGPVIQSNKARIIRQAAWSAFRWTYVPIAIASFGWYFLGLPNLGRGAFTGIMTHSMLLGPIAGIACLFLFHKAIVDRSHMYMLLSFIAIIPCLLAGSRSALLGIVAGILILIVFSIKRTGFNKSIPVLGIVIFSAVMGFVFLDSVKEKNLLYRYTSAIEEKGLNNSREELWASRLEEFKKSPLVGIGIGLGDTSRNSQQWTGVVVDDESGDVNIEPGSSYLAVLSMTGILGATGLVLILVPLLRKLRASKKLKMLDSDIFEVLAICAFFTVHLAAEGYIFAVGNQFCVLFWLCLGYLHDLILSKKVSESFR